MAKGAVIAVLGVQLGLMSAGDAQAAYTQNDSARLISIYQQINGASTLYCGCSLAVQQGRFFTDLVSCGYKVRKDAKRASRVEQARIMPPREFGLELSCWEQGGRKYCSNADAKFQQMEKDLHNIYPVIGELSKDRYYYRFSDWNAQPAQYGSCEMVVDFKEHKVQPPERARGKIARAYLYMADLYKLNLPDEQRRLFEAWDAMYKPASDECQRNVLIKQMQGNDNPFITRACRF